MTIDDIKLYFEQELNQNISQRVIYLEEFDRDELEPDVVKGWHSKCWDKDEFDSFIIELETKGLSYVKIEGSPYPHFSKHPENAATYYFKNQ